MDIDIISIIAQYRTLLLGALQGLCEFLPISSSGHLVLLQRFFASVHRDLSSGDGFLLFSLLLHCATMLAALLFFRREVWRVFSSWVRGWFNADSRGWDGWLYGWAILLANAATAAVGLPLKGAVASAMESVMTVGCCLVVTAALLSLAPLVGTRTRSVTFSAAAAIGIAQGLAVLPGISRSGATIFMGLLMGLSAAEAFKFSFLISMPAVFGASLLEAREVFTSPTTSSAGGAMAALPPDWMLGAAAAFILGLASLSAMRRLVISGKWAYFGLYCLLLGCGAIVVSLDIF